MTKTQNASLYAFGSQQQNSFNLGALIGTTSARAAVGI
jgi:hypothetical protein